MDYFKKYLKYKNKYLELKTRQEGGSNITKDFLIIIPAGDNSFHKNWTGKKTNVFDLFIIYFGDNLKTEKEYKNTSQFFIKKKGPKWQLIRHVLLYFNKDNFDWKKYKYIWIPDDDLDISQEDLHEFLLTSQKLKLKLSQPSLRPANLTINDQFQIIKDWNEMKKNKKKYIGWYSYYKNNKNEKTQLIADYISYKILLQMYPKKNKIIRYTNFVEIMCPLFEKSFLESVVHLFDEDFVQSGFGLDNIWAKKLNYQNIAVIDFISVIHMRKLGIVSKKKTGNYKVLTIDTKDETKENLKNAELDENILKIWKQNKKIISLNNSIKISNIQKGGYNDFYPEEEQSVFILNGPSSIYYFPDIKGKKILLLGDYHYTSNNCRKQLNFLKHYTYQTDTIRFINYLALMNSKKNTCLDFFNEEGFYHYPDIYMNYENLKKELKNANKNYFDPHNITAIGDSRFKSQLSILRYYFLHSDCGPIKHIKKKSDIIKYNPGFKKLGFENECYKGFRYHYWDIMMMSTKDKYKDGTSIWWKENVLFFILFNNDLSNEYFITKKLNNNDILYKYVLSIYTYVTGFKKNKFYKIGKKNYIELLKHFTNDKLGKIIFKKRYINKKYNNGDLKKYFMSVKETEYFSKKIQKQLKNLDKKYFNINDVYKYWDHRIKSAFIEGKYEVGENPAPDWDYDIEFISAVLRDSYVETYSIARMFRKFSSKKNIPNCDNKKSLQNIIYLSGDAHTRNFVDFIKWKFNIKPEISLQVDRNYESSMDNDIQQCLFVRKFNPFGFKMPWD